MKTILTYVRQSIVERNGENKSILGRKSKEKVRNIRYVYI